MDATTIALIIGLGSLFVERFFTWASRIKKSTCCLGGEIDMEDDNKKDEHNSEKP
jgi:hypothetical protein